MPGDLLSDDEFLGPSTAPKQLTDQEFLGSGHNDSGPLSNSGDEGWLSGTAKGAATATIKGLANIPGQVGNLANLSDYLFSRGHALATGRDWHDVYGELKQRQGQADQGLGGLLGATRPENTLPSGQDVAAPILKKTGEYEPDTELGKLGMAGGETALSMIGPGGGARAINAPVAATSVLPRIAETALIPAAKAAPVTALSGATAQGVTDLTGEPLLGMAAGIAVPAAGEAAGNVASRVAKPFAEDIPLIGKKFAGTRDAEVGKQIVVNSENPDAVKQALQPGSGQPLNTEIIPESKPTTGQFTGDKGLLGAEWAARTDKSGRGDEFAAADAAQNKARVDTLKGLGPASAETMKPSEVFQSQIDHLDQSTQSAVDRLTQGAQGAASGIQGAQTPEANGAALRGSIEAARTEAKALRSRLYDAVDPDGSLALVAAPVREAANKVAASVDPYGAPIEGPAQRILTKMQNLPDVMTFQNLRALEQDVTSAMSAERRTAGESPTWARLSQLNGAVKSAISNAVDNQAKYEAGAIARGELAPEQALEARVREAWNVPDARYANTRANVARADTGTGGLPGAGAPASTGVLRTGLPGAGRSGTIAGDQGISPTALQPNADAAAAGRLNAAKAAHADYAQTFKSEPIASAIKTTGFSGQYQTPASAIPSKAFVSGDKGYETMGAFLKAAGNSPDAIGALTDYARSSLAAKAMRPDGTLDPGKFAAWRSAHDGALRAIEERSPGFSGEFSTAARASDQMMNAAAVRKQALGDFQKSEAANFLGKKTPTEVEDTIGGLLANRKQDIASIENLVRQASADPAALAGLRKAGIDWMVRKFADQSGEQWIQSKNFRNFVNDRYEALARLYPRDQANMFRAIADDLQRADLTNSATAPRRGPGTAKDLAPVLKKAVETAKHHTSLFNAMMLSGMAGFEAHGLKGALFGAGTGGAGYALGSLRSAGIKTMDDMFRDALSNPERARYYLSKVPVGQQNPWGAAVARSLRRELLLAQTVGAADRQERADGGRVNKRDYPAKRASHLEKQANRIRKAYGGELEPLMRIPDHIVAHALRST